MTYAVFEDEKRIVFYLVTVKRQVGEFAECFFHEQKIVKKVSKEHLITLTCV